MRGKVGLVRRLPARENRIGWTRRAGIRGYAFTLTTSRRSREGRARYGIMLRETGVIFDDGTVVVLDEDRVLLTTTSSGAGRVAAWLEEWRQCEWPASRVVR